MESYIFSDLACEKRENQGELAEIEKYETDGRKGIAVSRRRGAEGEFVTIGGEAILGMSEESVTSLGETLAKELRRMIRRALPRPFDHTCSVMAVGLGNAALTPDALGPETVRRIFVTGAAQSDPTRCTVTAIAPDVAGNTGIESAELVRGAVSATKPDLIVAIDALSARDPTRVGAVIQLSDAGISPGGGVGNRRASLSQTTLGIPVLALGIPTVVRTASMLAEAFCALGLSSSDPTVSALLARERASFVTPKEIDWIVQSAAALLADGINLACRIPSHKNESFGI